MLPSNVGHQHNSQNNFKTTGCMHSITMLINNYPTGKEVHTVLKPSLRGRLEVFRPWMLWSWVLHKCIAFGKACVLAVPLWVKPCQSQPALKKNKSPFLSKEQQGMEADEGQMQTRLIVCLSAVALPIWWNYTKFTPDLHHSSDENLGIRNSVEEKVPKENLIFQSKFLYLW